MPANTAAWLGANRAPLDVRPAPYTAPGENEIVVKNHAVAVNPLEWILQLVGDVIYPWLKYPFVLGSDVAGEVVEVGPGVTRFAAGDRVLGHAVGTDKDANTSAGGAFQRYTVLLERMAAPIPDSMPFTDAVVLPLALSTAACGLFQKDQLALRYPSAAPTPTGQTVLIWGGSTSVGSNAIQLAVAAGYEVITTASPRNFDYVRALGASQVFDYASPTIVADLIAALARATLAGALALGAGSASACADVLAASRGRKFIALASTPATFESLADQRGIRWRLPRILMTIGLSSARFAVSSRLRGIRSKAIFGTSLKNNEVSTLIYQDFLPQALADGRYTAAPTPMVVGHGLEQLQLALDTQRRGVSARKVIVTL
ncbi:zinc-binding alcohol dehydrogenase family protein [Cryobacterium sp. PAMC25264]|uniref:zinc-binding alcohol dehydrogenase family protein n=1 Tax=Cryobacterium sp. PAMC25264 TaxID=2861288 RepID=UPI001C624852|nr:zinc-binding alcohol dehydrogenase family protein [Cryobacterium sp. PAMC25264]QYF74502.1 zinc-binding alcohol dehydrogenase family protein [Cryobacterium sp. PAMC25264]